MKNILFFIATLNICFTHGMEQQPLTYHIVKYKNQHEYPGYGHKGLIFIGDPSHHFQANKNFTITTHELSNVSIDSSNNYYQKVIDTIVSQRKDVHNYCVIKIPEQADEIIRTCNILTQNITNNPTQAFRNIEALNYRRYLIGNSDGCGDHPEWFNEIMTYALPNHQSENPTEKHNIALLFDFSQDEILFDFFQNTLPNLEKVHQKRLAMIEKEETKPWYLRFSFVSKVHIVGALFLLGLCKYLQK